MPVRISPWNTERSRDRYMTTSFLPDWSAFTWMLWNSCRRRLMLFSVDLRCFPLRRKKVGGEKWREEGSGGRAAMKEDEEMPWRKEVKTDEGWRKWRKLRREGRKIKEDEVSKWRKMKEGSGGRTVDFLPSFLPSFLLPLFPFTRHGRDMIFIFVYI